MQDVWRNRTFWQGLAVGLIVGLFVAWVIWPVRFVNAYPRDLREEDKLTYLLLVAKDYQRTGDVNALAARLASFDRKELPDLLLKAERRFQDDSEGATALGFLRQMVTLEPSAVSAETSTPSGAAQGGGVGRLLSYLFIGLGLAVLLVLAARVLVQVRSVRVAPWAPTPSEEELAPEAAPRTGEPPSRPQGSPVVREEEPAAEEEEEEAEAPAVAWGGIQAASEAVEEPVEEEEEVPEDVVEARPSPRPPQAAPPAPTLRQVDTYQSVFIAQAQGKQPFDDVFTIYDEKERTLGECGVAEAETLHNQPGQPIAMEVWLFDKQDTATHQAFILSPWAARQADIRAKYEEKGPVIVARAGAQVRLSARSLFLEGEIKDVAFAQSGEGDEVFTKLALALNVYRRFQEKGAR